MGDTGIEIREGRQRSIQINRSPRIVLRLLNNQDFRIIEDIGNFKGVGTLTIV